MRIIPAIDLIDGKCVRLTRGDYNAVTRYADNPVDQALYFQDQGIKYLHLVDLDGARLGSPQNLHVLQDIVTQTSLVVDYGGGMKSYAHVQSALNSGASQVTCGSMAVHHHDEFIRVVTELGSSKIILGADAQKRMIATHGWLQTTNMDVVDFIAGFEKLGIEYVVCTDIDKDGMLMGPSFELYNEILSATKVNLVASGGITSLNDVMELKRMGCEAAIIGKAIYEGKLTINELMTIC